MSKNTRKGYATMKPKIAVAFSAGVLVLLAASQPAETQTNGWRYLHPVAVGNCQQTFGPDAQQDFTIGVMVALAETNGTLRVISVAPSGPAAVAGIREGDSLWGSDVNRNRISMDVCELLRGERLASPLILYRQAQEQVAPVQVVVQPKTRREVYPHQLQYPVNIQSEFVDGGRFWAGATLAQGPHGDYELRVTLQNWATNTLLQLDEQKVFLLDASGNQLALYSYSTWKSYVERLIAEATALAEGMEQVPYIAPPQPPPPTHYRISGTTNSTYTLTPLGSEAYQLSGTSQTDLTMSPQYTTPELAAQAGTNIRTIIEDIRTARTNKKIKKLRERALADASALRKILAEGVAAHLDTAQPIPTRALRTGSVEFLPSTSPDSSTMRAVYVIADAASNKNYFVTFEFRR
jgi:hypothetical protein